MELQELEQLLKDIFKNEIPVMVKKQIDKLSIQYSYKDIGRCVYYFFVIKKNSVDSYHKYGIGIVPHVYEEATRYFERLKEQKEIQRNAAMQILKGDKKPIKITPNRRSFNKEEVNIDEL